MRAPAPAARDQNQHEPDHYRVQQVQLQRFDGQKWVRFGEAMSEERWPADMRANLVTRLHGEMVRVLRSLAVDQRSESCGTREPADC